MTKERATNERTKGKAPGATEAAIDCGWHWRGTNIPRNYIAACIEAEVAAGIDPLTGKAIVGEIRRDRWSILCLGFAPDPEGGTPKGDRTGVRGTGDG